jgi:hypothetical protein
MEEHQVVIRGQSNINFNKWEVARGANRVKAVIEMARALTPVGTRNAARLRLRLKRDEYHQYELCASTDTRKAREEPR